MVWKHPAETMLPLIVTMLPLIAVVTAAWLILFLGVYPDVEYDERTALTEDTPSTLVFWLVVLTWAGALFTAVTQHGFCQGDASAASRRNAFTR